MQGKTCGVVGIVERFFSFLCRLSPPFFGEEILKYKTKRQKGAVAYCMETQADRSYYHSGTTPSSLHLFRRKISEHYRHRMRCMLLRCRGYVTQMSLFIKLLLLYI